MVHYIPLSLNIFPHLPDFVLKVVNVIFFLSKDLVEEVRLALDTHFVGRCVEGLELLAVH